MIRRLLTLGCLLTAVWTAVVTVPGVYQVRLVDFAQEQQRTIENDDDARRMMTPMVGEELTKNLTLNPTAKGPVDAFIRKETKDRLYLAIGTEWSGFVDELRGVASGKAPAETRAMHASRNSLPEYAYYALTAEPLAELGRTIGPEHPFTYVQVGAVAKPRYLAVTYLRAVDAQHSAAPALLCPFRAQCPWWLLVAFLCYALLPWPHPREDTLCYSRGRSVIAPDILGMLFAAGFFALALLVVSRNSNMYAILSTSGWIKVTLWSLLFTIPGVAVLVASQWYDGFSLRLLPVGLRLTTWGCHAREIPFSELAEARTYTFRHPRWLITTMLIASFFRPRQAAPLLLMLQQTFPGLELVWKDGHTSRFVVSYFPRWQRVLYALELAGIPLSTELQQELDGYSESAEQQRIFPRWATVSLIVLVAVGIASGGTSWLRWQNAPPPISKRSLTTVEITAERRVLLEMKLVSSKLNTAMSTWEHAPAAKKEAAYAEYMRLLDRHQALSARFDEINEGRSELAPLLRARGYE